MRRSPLFIASLAIAATLASAPALAIKKVPYPEIAVRALPLFKGDDALTGLRKKLADAVKDQDLTAVIALLAPDFRWITGGATADEFDAKRDAAHNFKVAFGFRPVGRDADGSTDIGPQWGLLEFFGRDEILTQEAGSPLVCGSTLAKVTDAANLDVALRRVDEENDLSEWVYMLEETPLTATPSGGAIVARARNAAMPIVSVYPPPPEGGAPTAPPAPTHFELLLPSGKTGWAQAKNLHPLFVDRLCFAKSGNEWRIAVYDQAE
ncbi:MAG TPA: hypothetical protein VH765_03895 [Xanthobacteraceae bacterium]|jgi:hypothetical protein